MGHPLYQRQNGRDAGVPDGERLLVVAGDGGVGLPDGDLLDADTPFGGLLETLIALVIKILGEVFRRRIEDGEGLDVIDHLVIEIVNDGLHDQLQFFEVQQQASVVELRALQGDVDTIVVAMRILALAFVVAQVMTRRKGVLHGYFKHESPDRMRGIRCP
jgi:hypothetical protein